MIVEHIISNILLKSLLQMKEMKPEDCNLDKLLLVLTTLTRMRLCSDGYLVFVKYEEEGPRKMNSADESRMNTL